MRNAKFKDYWKKVNVQTSAHTIIKSVSIEDKRYQLSNFQVISGQNGSGKSSLLKHLASVFQLFEPLNRKITLDLQRSNIVANDTQILQYASPSWLVEENLRRVDELRNNGKTTDLLDGVEAFAFSADLLERVNYILNTNFREIEIFELERALGYSETAEQESSPVTVNPDNSEGSLKDFLEGKALYIQSASAWTEPAYRLLSHGEQYIILLTYILHTRRGRSILLDEPETYLSPLSQYRLCDILARSSVDNKLQFILATHSICFVESAGQGGTIMVDGAHAGEISFTTGKRVTSYLRRLGYKIPRENVALFEDEAAQRFFSNIARTFDADWLASFELIYLNGESDIIALIERIKNYKVTAIFDADQRGKTDPQKYPKHDVLFLPGSYAPEIELIGAIRKFPSEFAQRLGMCETDLRGYLRQIEGIDHHDYFDALATLTQGEKWRYFDDAFYIWANANIEKIDDFLENFK